MIYHISFSKEKLLIALTMIFGVYLTCSGVENQSLLAIILGLLSALSYAILSLFQKYFINKYSSRVICFFQQSVATIILLPSLFSFSGTITLFEIVCLLFLGIVCTALGHSLYVSSLKYVDVKSASIISSMETVYGIILAFLLLHQIPSLKVLCGGIIILLMSVYLSLKEK